MESGYLTREAFFLALTRLIEQECFAPIGVVVRRYKVSTSFAYKGGANVLGQCISPHATADHTAQIAISPFEDNSLVVGNQAEDGLMTIKTIDLVVPP
jgi:hypothetical protein